MIAVTTALEPPCQHELLAELILRLALARNTRTILNSGFGAALGLLSMGSTRILHSVSHWPVLVYVLFQLLSTAWPYPSVENLNSVLVYFIKTSMWVTQA
jgi:hypothetical protein